jgi:alpha-D-xyloside xylohydrolase
VRWGDKMVAIGVISDSVLRISSGKDAAILKRDSIDVVAKATGKVPFRFSQTPLRVSVATGQVEAVVDLKTSAVSFRNNHGTRILSEEPSARTLEPAQVQGETTFHVGQRWVPNGDESLYGLGQQQLGTLDIKSFDFDLWQHNTNVVVPFLVSSKGYGVLWDNTSLGHFGDLAPFGEIPSQDLLDKDGNPGGVSTEALGSNSGTPQKTPSIAIQPPERGRGRTHSTRWEGSILAPESGDYQFQTYSNGGIRAWFDGHLLIDHWRQSWLPSNDQIKLHFEKGQKCRLKVEWDSEDGSILKFLWKTPVKHPATALWSEVGDGVDYYFVYGPSLDKVISGYRLLTGRATMMPNWAFGLWQSRQRYETAQQSLDVVDEFRKRQIPFDNIVQDWQYWPTDAWGSHLFDPVRFPDPDGWIKKIHDMNAHVMISVWGKFYPGTANFKALKDAGFLYQPPLDQKFRDWIGFPYTFYDGFSAPARKLFWSQIDSAIFQRGMDAWWMDASEPDLTPGAPSIEGQRTNMNPTAMGPASRVLNGYGLLNAKGIDEGQLAADPNKRVFILTRSGYAGEQRYSTATWSGDITSTWTALAKQIPAGLGFSISGVPYWTMDTGGYTMQRKFSTKNPTAEDEAEWKELNARWFELSTFTPLLRVHGELRPREMWTLGEGSPAYDAELKFDRLRYRLMPFLYSLAGAVTQQDRLFMRPLVMDFPSDRVARELTDEYMFGNEFLVAPITRYRLRERPVYLPGNHPWYDFWTGTAVKPGTSSASAPLDTLPLFVKSGSIIPVGPEVQYVAEKKADPLTIYVYEGANGSFNLYEDAGVDNGYLHGAFSTIPITWNDRDKVLTIGKRAGAFPGMLSHRTLQFVFISPSSPVPFSFNQQPSKSAQYDGSAITIKP